MRSLVLLFVTVTCLTVRGEPLPEIKVGDSGGVIEISMTPWYSGFISTSEAFLAGTVMEASPEVQTTPQQTWLLESCVIRVERAFGRLKGIEGISTARLPAGYDHSLYRCTPRGGEAGEPAVTCSTGRRGGNPPRDGSG
jgi:hypothetical protein